MVSLIGMALTIGIGATLLFVVLWVVIAVPLIFLIHVLS